MLVPEAYSITCLLRAGVKSNSEELCVMMSAYLVAIETYGEARAAFVLKAQDPLRADRG